MVFWDTLVEVERNRVVLRAVQHKTLRFMDDASLYLRKIRLIDLKCNIVYFSKGHIELVIDEFLIRIDPRYDISK